MTEVLIKQINGVWAQIVAPLDVLLFLRQYFSFEVPNAKFMKKHGRSSWDGKIYLIDRKNRIYIGLVPEVYKALHDKSCKIIFVFDDFYKKYQFTESYVDDWVDNLKLKVEPRDYQMDLVRRGILEKRSTFLSATSSGKSLCIYLLTRFWFEHLEKNRILIIVPNIHLVTQLYKNFQEYGWTDTEKYVQEFHHEVKNKNKDKPIIISTWQSAKGWKDLNTFDVVIFDEVHTAKAKEIRHCIEKTTSANIRYGFTGTLDDETVHHYIIEGLFGPRQEIISLTNLIDSGHATELKIMAVGLNHKKSPIIKEYHDEIDYLISLTKRNEFISKLAKHITKKDGNTMILFHRISHGKELFSILKEIYDPEKVHLIYGQTKSELREAIRQIVNLNDGNIIVASIQVFSVGVDLPFLKNMILACPTKSKIRLLQSIGRILRKHKEKRKCIFYDIGDKFPTKYKNYTWNHFMIRMEHYMKESFDVKFSKIDLT